MYTYLSAGADEQRTDIERSTAFVGRNEALIELHHLLHHFLKLIGGQFRHQNAAASALKALRIVLHTEHADFSVRTTECLESFKGLLAIVEASGRHMDVDGVFRRHFNFAPLAVAIVTAHVVVGGQIAELQVGPVNILHIASE